MDASASPQAAIVTPMPAPTHISKQTARRFVLGKQGLWPGRRWSGKAGADAAMRACEHLQLDPLVIVARSHDLMLHARVDGYSTGHFEELTTVDRAFFDWGGWLAVRPMDDLPYWRVFMRRERNHPGMQSTLAAHGPAIDEMRAVLQTGAVVGGRDFPDAAKLAVRSYRGGKESSVALYHLWRTGEAMTHHRDRFERAYAASELVAPAHLLVEADERAAELHLARSAVAFEGIGRVKPLPPYVQYVSPPATRADAEGAAAELLRSGVLLPVEVEGWRPNQVLLAEDEPLMEEVSRGGVPTAWEPTGASTLEEVTFLSPLDPLVARGRAKTLFDIDYVWEIYKKAEDVRFGRYTMPMLFGDTLVGRLDPKMDRKSNTLVINGLWLEDEASPHDGRFVDALRRGTIRLARFLGADRVDASAVGDATLRDYVAVDSVHAP